MIIKLAPEASCLKEASRGEMKNSGYVCRSLCGILSDAGSTPAASTSLTFEFQHLAFLGRALLRCLSIGDVLD